MEAQHESTSDTQEPSYFELATHGFNAFRILLAGKSGSGKSTLVNEVFDFDDADVQNIQHYSIGEHDINKPILSSNNKALILHDSKGLETGSDINSETIARFLGGRAGRSMDEQVHAIWYCVEIPLGGERLFEGGEIKLFTAIKNACPKIPLVVVFTKLDKLQFQEKRRLKKEYTSKGLSSQEAKARMQEEYVNSSREKYTKTCLDILKSVAVLKGWARYTIVSTKQPSTIVGLIELTKVMLSESEPLSILFARAQMADVNLKVTLSLRAAKNMLRFQGAESKAVVRTTAKPTVRKVLNNIHSDILAIWNLKDLDGILASERMRIFMAKQCTDPSLSAEQSAASAPQTFAEFIASVLSPDSSTPASPPSTPPTADSARVLDDSRNAMPAVTRVLIAYTIDLTLALENLHWALHSRKDKAVARADVVHAFAEYGASARRVQVSRGICGFTADEADGEFAQDAVLRKINALAEANRLVPTTASK